jgi:hypothetical protein
MDESEPGRDLSRGHLERSVGAAITNQVMVPYYADCQAPLRDINTLEVEVRGIILAKQQQLRHKAWGMAQVVTGMVMNPGGLQLPNNNERYAVDDLVAEGMFGGSIAYSMREGVETQAHFPIRLAHDISKNAKAQRVRGFRATNLHDIAAMLRRPDFREMVDTAASTANGIWGAYSTSYTMPLPPTDNEVPPLGFMFDRDGSVHFSPQMEEYLHNAVQGVNRKGAPVIPSSPKRDAASSGCPARRLKPTFLNTAQDTERLELLARYFDTTPEAIVKPLKTNVITQGLDITADALEYVDNKILDTKPLGTLLVQKIGHAVGQRLLY